jgi:hypothetical protein
LLDRIVRDDESGAEPALGIFRRFWQRGGMVVSVRESWLTVRRKCRTSSSRLPAGWLSASRPLRSERIKAGLARRRAEGKAAGRQAGAKDKGKRRRSGCVRLRDEGGGRCAAAGHR